MKRLKKLALLTGCLIAVSAFLVSCNETCEHEWGAYYVAKQATCTQDGILERTCERCQEKDFKEVKAAHDYDANGVCTECGAVKDEETGDGDGTTPPPSQGGGNIDEDDDEKNWTGNY